jgi:hypothetical protein
VGAGEPGIALAIAPDRGFGPALREQTVELFVGDRRCAPKRQGEDGGDAHHANGRSDKDNHENHTPSS